MLLALGCSRAPDDLREWRVADHDHTTNPGATQVEVQADGGSPLSRFGIDEVTLVAWQQNCTRCHGQLGQGDGPQGALTRARDLSDPVWQATVTDESIERTIREGRGLMPATALPDTTVKHLVRLVRLLKPRAPDPAGASSAPPPAPASATAASGGASAAQPLPSARPVPSAHPGPSPAPSAPPAPSG